MLTTNRDLHQVAAIPKNVSETGLLVAYYAASLLSWFLAGVHPNGIASMHMMCFASARCITLHSMHR